MDDDDQEGDQENVASLIARDLQGQQRRHMRGAEDTDHQRPLHLRDPEQEVARVAVQNRDDRHQQKGIDRHEDRIDAVLLGPKQEIIDRQHDEEGRGDRPVVTAAGVDERDEFTQRRERTKGKEQQHADPTSNEGDGNQHHHRPPRLDAGVEVLDRAVRSVR
ncbi:hypothetical protein D9M72_518730 [compost metagenome]